tara:strand:- start:1246 stop:1416 length:171 start_codon:yes stop_codon:yes gene_type:complete
MRYKLKDKYKDVSICPSGKNIVLQFLNQAQIKLVIKAGYSEYFEEVDKKPKKTDKK